MFFLRERAIIVVFYVGLLVYIFKQREKERVLNIFVIGEMLITKGALYVSKINIYII